MFGLASGDDLCFSIGHITHSQFPYGIFVRRYTVSLWNRIFDIDYFYRIVGKFCTHSFEAGVEVNILKWEHKQLSLSGYI